VSKNRSLSKFGADVPHEEVVLSLLIESFKFSPANKEIVWNMGGISSPSVKGHPEPQLPLIIEMIQQ